MSKMVPELEVKEEADKERKQAKKLHVASINVYQWSSSQINAFLLYRLVFLMI